MKVNLTADLLLVHTPAYFDFRNNGEVYWPFLSSGGSEPITPLYENFPVGFKTLQRFLNNRTPKAGDCACPCFRAYRLFLRIYKGWLLVFEPLFSAMDHLIDDLRQGSSRGVFDSNWIVPRDCVEAVLLISSLAEGVIVSVRKCSEV